MKNSFRHQSLKWLGDYSVLENTSVIHTLRCLATAIVSDIYSSFFT